MPKPSILYLRRIGNALPVADALERHPDLPEWRVEDQQQALNRSGGPFSAPMVDALQELGWDSYELILGVQSIRDAWTREYGPLPDVPGIDDPDARMAVGEILRRRPAVVLDVNVSVLDRMTVAYLRRAVPELRVLAGRMGTTKRYHRALHLDLSLVPCAVIADAIRPFMRGEVHVLPHSFDARRADSLPPRSVEHPLVFTGVLGPRYAMRHQVLLALLNTTPIEAWVGLRKGVQRQEDGRLTFGDPERSRRSEWLEQLPPKLLAIGARRSDRLAAPFNAVMARRSGGMTRFPSSLADPLRQFPDRCHPAVAGDEYLDLIRRSGTVVHRETDDLNGCGGALRLFEVTGVGAALLVDDSPMVRRLFDVDGEVITYRTPNEAVSRARWLLDHPEEREAVAAAGQARTLREHSTTTRARQLDEILRHALLRGSHRRS